jgi:hypothetical protein
MDSDHLSDEYLVHQARTFHTYATEAINDGLRGGSALANLAAAVEYLIELEEKRHGSKDTRPPLRPVDHP